MRRLLLALVAPVLGSLLLTACSADREPSEKASPTKSSVEQARDATFGDMKWPCGPAEEANTDDGTETGVTAKSVTIAAGDDAGFAASPGVNHEATDAVRALVEKCNDLGGIHGRTIDLNYYDAKITEIGAAISSACDDGNFFLVGEGWALDVAQEEMRLSCGLPAVPTYTVSAAFAHGANVFQGVPNPADETYATRFDLMARLFPKEVKAAATFSANYSATRESNDKVLAVAPDFGWKFVSTGLEYNIEGEADWTPFVKQLKASGAELIVWPDNCLPNLPLFTQTAKANGYEPLILTESNTYESACSKANTDGALDKVYIPLEYVPFEEAGSNKATKDYLDLLKASGGDTSLLGMQATSSFFLWAKAANACGTKLTRDCVLDALADVHDWSAGGLHAPTDPGGNHPSTCTSILKLDGTAYARVTPERAATYECDKERGVVKITGTPVLGALKLDGNRISHQFG